jgi:hypothetical protein
MTHLYEISRKGKWSGSLKLGVGMEIDSKQV